MKTLRCANSDSGNKYYTGHTCNNIVPVSESTEKVVCWACVVRLLGNPAVKQEVQKNIGFPRGWKFMSEYVDADGNVYHKGIIQPELKGTKSPSKIKKQKVKKKENDVDFEKIKELKTKIKLEKDLKKKRKLENKLSSIIRGAY
jgi:hypothetical protein